MEQNCHTPERNMCAPDGKFAALFVDIDGTVMECQPYFDAAVEEFAKLMTLCGFSRLTAKQTLNAVYYGSMPHRGFERHKFGLALAEAYKTLCRENGRRPNKTVRNICSRIGMAPFFNAPVLFSNVLPVLTRAQHNFLIIAVTVGDREVQKYKIRQGGLSSIFDDEIITLSENKAERVREYIEDMDVSAAHSAFIGNSMRSDGQTLTETNFIYLPLENSLAAPNDKFPENTGFHLFHATNWREVEERALKRLIRRRRKKIKAFDRNGTPLVIGSGAEPGSPIPAVAAVVPVAPVSAVAEERLPDCPCDDKSTAGK